MSTVNPVVATETKPNGLPVDDVVTFEQGKTGSIAYHNGKVCIPDGNYWIASGLPKPGDRWLVSFEAENPNKTVYFVAPIEAKGTDESVIFPEDEILTFCQGRRGVIATINGRTAIPCSDSWTGDLPKDKEKWEVHVVGSNSRKTVYFVSNVRFVGVYDPLKECSPLPEFFTFVLSCDWDRKNGVATYIRGKEAFVEKIPDGVEPLPGSSWIAQILEESEAGIKLSLLSKQLCDSESPAIGTRHKVIFKEGKKRDIITFLDHWGGKVGFPAKEYWGKRLPSAGEVWIVDIIEVKEKAYLLAPVCHVETIPSK